MSTVSHRLSVQWEHTQQSQHNVLPQVPRLPSDLEKEMFIFGYCTELHDLRRLQYLYERDTRIYWNGIYSPELPYETLYYYDTDRSILDEVEIHIEKGDLELAYLRASGPSVRYKFIKNVSPANTPLTTPVPECLRELAASLRRVTKHQSNQMKAIYAILKQPSLRISLCRESRITAGTFSQILRSLKVEGKDFMDALPSAESLCSAVAFGANSAWGLGTPADRDSLEIAYAQIARALPSSFQLACARWYDRNILDLNEQSCPFCYNPATNPISNLWAVFAFWVGTSRTKQDRLLALCASTSSNVNSLAVCADSNWTSETAG